MDGLLDGNERADANVCQTLDRFDNHFDVLPLLVCCVEDLQRAKLRKDPPNLGLKNDDDCDRKERRENAQQPAQHLQMKDIGNQAEGEQEEKRAGENGCAASAADGDSWRFSGLGEVIAIDWTPSMMVSIGSPAVSTAMSTASCGVSGFGCRVFQKC